MAWSKLLFAALHTEILRKLHEMSSEERVLFVDEISLMLSAMIAETEKIMASSPSLKICPRSRPRYRGRIDDPERN